MYDVNPNVKHDIRNNWWLQPYFFIQSGQQIRKEAEDMNMITLKDADSLSL